MSFHFLVFGHYSPYLERLTLSQGVQRSETSFHGDPNVKIGSFSLYFRPSTVRIVAPNEKSLWEERS